MPTILPQEHFDSQYRDILEQYLLLRDKFPEDKKWRKVHRVMRQMKGAYGRDKVYAVKYLNYFEMV